MGWHSKLGVIEQHSELRGVVFVVRTRARSGMCTTPRGPSDLTACHQPVGLRTRWPDASRDVDVIDINGSVDSPADAITANTDGVAELIEHRDDHNRSSVAVPALEGSTSR